MRVAISRYRKAMIETVGTSWFEHLRHELMIVTRVARIEQRKRNCKAQWAIGWHLFRSEPTTHTLRNKYHFLTAASRTTAY